MAADVSADVERIEKLLGESLPDALAILLEETDNASGVWFMDKPLLSANAMLKHMLELKLDCLPFCGNEEVGMLVVLPSGEVHEWDADDGVGDVVAKSFSSYLEEYRNFLLNGNGEFLSDVGVVEKLAIVRK